MNMNIADEMILKLNTNALSAALAELHAAAFALQGPAAVALVGRVRGESVELEVRPEAEPVQDHEVVLYNAPALTGDEYACYRDAQDYANSRGGERAFEEIYGELRSYASTLRSEIAREGAEAWMSEFSDYDRELDNLKALRLGGVQYLSEVDYVRAWDPLADLSDREAKELYAKVLECVEERVS